MTATLPRRDVPRAFFTIDGLRASAALIVLVSHARDFTFRDAGRQAALSAAGRFFYFVSGLGHQAVIVFFVVSGFLVTGSMMRMQAEGRWSLRRFATARLIRLWAVLIPCLHLGAALDETGLGLSHGTLEAARYGALAMTPPMGPPPLDPMTFLGNMAFLQTIVVEPYGSNGPLWSLANEAWYYAVAALLFGAWQRRQSVVGALPHAAGAIALAACLPAAILALAPVWAVGAALALFGSPSAGRPGDWPRRASATGFAAALVTARIRLGPPLLADATLGLATAWMLWAFLDVEAPGSWLGGAVRFLSKISYSLYLSHGPLLALLSACVMGPGRRAFDAVGLVWIAAELGLALALASVLWWCFERHTPLLHRLAEAGLDTVLCREIAPSTALRPEGSAR